uniref:Beta-arrestin-1 n=1 Tax=Hippocampus comes TaxID=109280 RepID=A0A3Q2YMT8_HIPCM
MSVWTKQCGLALTVYLGKRDFVDHVDRVEPVDGVILIDPDYLKERKVFVTLTCAFRYGREDLDVLGLTFRKDLFVANAQVFPPVGEAESDVTRLQERLMKKLGEHAYPFTFQMPLNLPCSVTLQPGPEDTGKVAAARSAGARWRRRRRGPRRNSVRLVIRKVQFAPEKAGPQPAAETTRHFLMSDKALHLEASLDKQIYYHGEPISVNVHVTNNSNKTVKKMKVSGTEAGGPGASPLLLPDAVASSSTSCKVFTLTPFLCNNREKRGLALDGKLKHEDTNLASSTQLREGADKEMLGIVVSYKVKVKLLVSRGGSVSSLAFHFAKRVERPLSFLSALCVCVCVCSAGSWETWPPGKLDRSLHDAQRASSPPLPREKAAGRHRAPGTQAAVPHFCGNRVRLLC